MYSLEVLLPTKPYIDIFLKKMIKQILSLPQNTPDTVPYSISYLDLYQSKDNCISKH